MNIKSLKERPLLLILTLAATLRFVASFFSEGYLMHDDHFWVVETSASWADGYDYNNWLPWSQEELGKDPQPHYSNLFYSSLHYIYFVGVDAVGMDNPREQMLILRLMHGLYSLIAVALAYLIALNLGGRKPAILTGVLMASLAWIPIMSVHQIVEVVVIVPLLAFSWVLTKYNWTTKTLIIAGACLGIATGLRYQVGVMGIGLIAAFVIEYSDRKVWVQKSAIIGTSALLSFSLTQVPTDMFLWGEPFAQLKAYIEYNLNSSGDYPQGNIFTYLFVILSLAAPPLSVYLFFGYLKSWRKYAWLVFPSLAFILFHSLFPNKQERFILPALPYIVIVGSLVWHEVERNKKLSGSIITLSILINLILLVPITLSSKNASQLNAMDFIRMEGDLDKFLYVQTDSKSFPPRFYSDNWNPYTYADENTDVLGQKRTHCLNPQDQPNYIVFVGDSHLGEFVNEFKSHYTTMEYVSQFGPGRLDRFLNYLNPLIHLKRTMVYKIDPTLECADFKTIETE
ncbi:MAG: hypothetical protein CL847_05675 [Crocinitomicaceae bacterium]|nr:hypothetical protein [Crocinitomicaceae bacterium]|tara:strand:+ start:4202 stop:5737 length:1536 start_codon:yes stop_codon:yes gene_type:complete